MNPDGIALPQTADPRKMDPKALWDQLQEERRAADRRVLEEKQRSRMELERLRGATSQHIKDLEDQNKALLRSLSRLQRENDDLNREITTLQVKLDNNGYREEAPVQAHPSVRTPVAPVTPVLEPPMPPSAIQIVTPAAPTLGGEAIPPAIKPQGRA